jgi:DNA mismatch repair protein MutL
MPIQILPDEVASQIAAGEVVERPASVVKELLENSLDAGASWVTIKVEAAGKELVEVADDGAGIPADELALAVARHATSKLQQGADLFRITSLGFRGEALASIGSVSRLTIISRTPDADLGARLYVDGGHPEVVVPTGCPPGTIVRVEGLFYNVPARLKFLKTDRTERGRIDELVSRYALAYPNVRFQLTQDGRVSLQTSGNGDAREVLGALYGGEIARKMLIVDSVYEDLTVKGFISPISLTRSNRREITLFINGRWVQDAALSAALIQAYHTMIMVGRYPMAALFLELPPGDVDVNVHPAKAEVRFRDRNSVFSGVRQAVRRGLMAHTQIPAAETGLRWTPAVTSPHQGRRWDTTWGAAFGDVYTDSEAAGSVDESGPSQVPLPVSGVPLLRLIGQVGSAFLVAEGPDGLYLIDQHAAHERVLFERMIAQQGKPAAAQTLLEPVSVQLPPAQARRMEAELVVLNELGFDVEPFGPSTLLVRAVPELLAGMDPGAAIRVLVEDFEEDETPLQSETEARMIARICKRAAVKAGQVLSQEEQAALLRDLESCQAPRTCPHGRPTMIHLSVDLLERQFGRR